MARALRLGDAAYGALAAGRPGPAALAALRRAALSRHLLLLAGIRRAAPEATAAAWAALEAAERAAPRRVRAVLARPLVGAWAAACLAALRAGADPVTAGAGYLDVLAAGGPPPGRLLAAGHGGLRLRLRLADRDPQRARLGLPPLPPLDDAAVARWRALLAAAWRQLTERDARAARVPAAVLRCLVPVHADPGARGVSASAADAYGAVAVSAPADADALAVALLHEAQHSVLNAVGYLFDLHTGPATAGYSPWRDDPRPPAGLLHGAYAYLAVTRHHRAGAGPLAAFEFARWRAAVAGAADRLLAGAGLTPAGTRFVAALRAEVTPWLAEPVDPGAARLAAGANADHRLRWRLRNLAVDPAAVRALAAAWHRGDPAPAVAPSVPRPAGGRALERSERLDLVHAWLRGVPAPPPGPGGPGAAARRAGDRAWLRGDAAAAAGAYRAAVRAGPGDDAAWAGLALTAGLPALDRRPELVAALCRRVGGDPLTVAAWIGESSGSDGP